jgi:hypothetical protein
VRRAWLLLSIGSLIAVGLTAVNASPREAIAIASQSKRRGTAMKRSVRKLIAWMDERRAVAELLGERRGGKAKGGPETALWEAAHDAMNRRAVFNGSAVPVHDLPTELAAQAAEFQQRPDVLAWSDRSDWRLGVVDLSEIIAFQPIVADEVDARRIANASQDDWPSLFTTCLPGPLLVDQLDVYAERFDPITSAFTMSSLNPNFRVIRPGLSDNCFEVRRVGPGTYERNQYAATDKAAHSRNVGFVVGVKSSFVKVVEYSNRLYLVDGYHRCYGLLRRGVTRVPCVVVRVNAFDETGMNQPGGLGAEILGGERPPFVSDFLDDRLAATVEEAVFIKVVRIVAHEFTIRARHPADVPPD